MFNLWSPEHSTLREKVLEHIFLAELSKKMLLDLRTPFEVLRSEFDGFGYDVVLEARGVLRHVQLKAMKAGGKRARVDVGVALGQKPGGCVIWFAADEHTLDIGPFYWLGGVPGERLPDIGDRPARHSRGNASGVKAERLAQREVPKRDFQKLNSIGEVAVALFGPVDDHDQLLRDHLARRGIALDRIAPGSELRWPDAIEFASMIDAHELANAAGLGDPFRFAGMARAAAERDGRWQGTALELWVTLCMEVHQDRWQSEGPIGLSMPLDPLPLLDELAAAFASALRRLPRS